MTNDEIKAMFASMHNPALVRESHVSKLWEDGEITSEKGADLYGARNLHKIEYALGDLTGHDMQPLPLELMPERLRGGPHDRHP